MQPPHLDARLPEAIEVAIAGKHVLDPSVVGAIAPLVIAGFDEYASGPPEHIDTSAISLGPEWSLVEWLGGADGANRPGWPRFVRDTICSSPALHDLDGDGHLDACRIGIPKA